MQDWLEKLQITQVLASISKVKEIRKLVFIYFLRDCAKLFIYELIQNVRPSMRLKNLIAAHKKIEQKKYSSTSKTLHFKWVT